MCNRVITREHAPEEAAMDQTGNMDQAGRMDQPPRMDQAGDEALDAYSQIVTGVAERLTPRVAALRIRHQGSGRGSGDAAGSAVVLTNGGHLLTNAHVVEGAREGQAAFADG